MRAFLLVSCFLGCGASLNTTARRPYGGAELTLISTGARAVASARGNLSPASVVALPNVGDWLKDRWQAASDMKGTPIPGEHWIQYWIEIGKRCTVEKAVLDWETARADDYEVQMDIDGIWVSLRLMRYSRDESVKQHVVDVLIRPATTPEPEQTSQVFRLLIRKPATKWGASLWRFELWADCEDAQSSARGHEH
ncbi:hypothetical protein M885DRAFT_611373 [Pelagophyceae sp. CCMP2097]|nr:hypothetical protein M885DRAFT_611373 [Pelagophyceae sp. CCMP2097]|mmetsp:Transcript_27722/g.93147  ORF Transcript_27722/g.93147 Transcript_27722/m.93147 type:complete len:195 (-) Transcript_27722:10-594(-)